MGIFNQKSKFKATAPPTIRKELVVVDTTKPKKKPRPPAPSRLLSPHLRVASASSDDRDYYSPISSSSTGGGKSASPRFLLPDRAGSATLKRKKAAAAAAHRRPSQARDGGSSFDRELRDSSSDDDDDWVTALDGRGRRKRAALGGERRLDLKRQLAHPVLLRAAGALAGDGGGGEAKEERLRMIHAADVASLALKCEPALGAAEDEVAMKLQYPGSRQRERWVTKRRPIYIHR